MLLLFFVGAKHLRHWKKMEERETFWFYQRCGPLWTGKLRTEAVLEERLSFFRDSRRTTFGIPRFSKNVFRSSEILDTTLGLPRFSKNDFRSSEILAERLPFFRDSWYDFGSSEILEERLSVFRNSRRTSSVLDFPIKKQDTQNQNVFRSRRIS